MNEEQNINQLPKDWKWEKLDDALDFVIGGDWGKDENFEDPNYGPAYCIRGSEIKNWEEEKGRTASLRKIKLSNIEKRKLVEGDILVEISGGGPEQPVGRTVLIDKTVLNYKPEIPKICTNFLRLIRPKDYVEGKFLNLYLKLFYYSGEIVNYQGGSNNLRNLKFPDFVKINFPLPPKPTQLAIVSKIEELFSELDKGVENLRLAQQQLKTYRQSVLKWAFEGKLTNENVKEGELPGGWKLAKLKEIASDISDGDHQAPPKSNSGVPFITISNVNKENNKIDFSDTFSVNEEYYAKLKINRKPIKGDVLYTVTGSFGIPILIDYDKVFCFQRHIGLVRPLDTTNQKWLYYLLQSPYVFNQAKSTATGTAQKTVALNSLRNFEVPYCKMEEQSNIVQEIESRLSVADKMEESINQSLQQAEALRQSILKKAFEGRLV